MELGGSVEDAPQSCSIWRQAGVHEHSLIRPMANLSTPMRTASSFRMEKEERKNRDRITVQNCAALFVVRAIAPTVEWPSKLWRSLALAGSEQARETAEQQERQRWVTELQGIVRTSVLPIMHSTILDAALLSAGQGRRARAIRKRVRDVRKLLQFCTVPSGHPWP